MWFWLLRLTFSIFSTVYLESGGGKGNYDKLRKNSKFYDTPDFNDIRTFFFWKITVVEPWNFRWSFIIRRNTEIWNFFCLEFDYFFIFLIKNFFQEFSTINFFFVVINILIEQTRVLRESLIILHNILHQCCTFWYDVFLPKRKFQNNLIPSEQPKTYYLSWAFKKNNFAYEVPEIIRALKL